jgi:hypothetical protein
MTFSIFLSLIGFPIAVAVITFLCYFDQKRKDEANEKVDLQGSSKSTEIEGGL